MGGSTAFCETDTAPTRVAGVAGGGEKNSTTTCAKSCEGQPEHTLVESSTAIGNELGRVEASDEAYCGAHSG